MKPSPPATDAGALEALRKEVEQDAKRLQEKQEVLALAEKLAAKGAPFGIGVVVEQPAATPEPSLWRKPTWNTVVREVMNRTDRGLSSTDVLHAVQAMPESSLLVGFKGLYNVLRHMSENGQLIRHGFLYYPAALYEKLKASGQPLPTKGGRAKNAPVQQYVVEILGANPLGCTLKQLSDELRKRPDCPTNVKAHGASYLMRRLNGLIANGVLVQDGEIFRLAKVSTKKARPKEAKGRTLSGRPTPQVATKSGQDPDLSGLH